MAVKSVCALSRRACSGGWQRLCSLSTALRATCVCQQLSLLAVQNASQVEVSAGVWGRLEWAAKALDEMCCALT